MKAIIMAGGYGTRLQPLTLRTPKCTLPVGNTTAIELILNQLKQTKVSEIIISLNKNQIKVKEFIDNKKYDLNIKYIFEKTNKDEDKLGVIGALLYVIKEFGSDDYFILGADNYTCGLDYKKMLEEHIKTNSDISIALYELRDISKVSSFGIGVIDKDSNIISFQEKPKVIEAKSKLASTFIYIVNKMFLKKHLPNYVKQEILKGKKPDNIGDLWVYYSDKLKIHGYSFQGFWGDVGRPLPYVKINHNALELINSKIHESVKLSNSVRITGKVIIEKNVKLGEDVVIIGPCIIKQNTIISNGTIIGPYTTILKNGNIGKDNIISGSIIFEDVKTFENVRITRALIDGKAIISKNVKIEEQAIVGYNVKIKENSQLLYNTKLWPFIKVDKDSIINAKISYPLEKNNFKQKIKNSKYWE